MLWLTSWIAGRWLPIAIVAGLVAGLATAYGYGRSHANTRWEARWAEAEGAARVVAARQEERWKARDDAAQRALDEARQAVSIRDGIIGRVNDSVRQLAARPRNLPPPADYAICVRELARERQWTAEGRDLLSEGAGLSAALGSERDINALSLWAAAETWPR